MNGLEIGIRIDGDGDAAGPGGLGIRIEGGDDLEAFFFEAMVAQQRGTEISRADEDDGLEVLAAEGFADGGGEEFDRIAEAAGAELPEVGEILAELRGLHPGGAGERGGTHGVHAVGTQFLEAAVSRSRVDRSPFSGYRPSRVFREDPRDGDLEVLGFLEDGGNAVEQDSGTAAIDDAVVEGEQQVSDGRGEKCFDLFAPNRFFDSRTDAEDEGFIRKGNGRAGGEAEGAEIRHGGDASAAILLGEAAAAGAVHQIVVFGNEVAQGFLIHFPDDGHDHPVLDLHGHADVERARGWTTLSPMR